jgi:hypothetical protein
MNTVVLSTPRFGFIVATRAALALGIGLLIAERLDDDQRRAIGKALVAAGGLATIPAALFLRQSVRGSKASLPRE